LIFLYHSEIKTVILKPNAKFGTLHSERFKNETKNTYIIVDSTWNRISVRNGGFSVSGHFRLQPCGLNNQDRKLVFIEEFKKHIRDYKVRHLVKSGITGWAPVNGWRGDTSIKNRVEHDIYYLENWNFWFDIRIIWMTVFGQETKRHAY